MKHIRFTNNLNTFEANLMTNLTLSKEELCLISIALNEYQMELDNYHLDEMKEVSTKIDNHYKQLITNGGKS